MIGAIVGDIIGSRFEWNNIKTKEFELFKPYSRPTDDSMMTIAIAAAILDADSDIEKVGLCAIKWMKEIGRSNLEMGYGGHFYEWLISEDSKPYNSWGNGSAMRVSPCAYVSDSIDVVLEYSDKVTEVTHNHPEGIKGARAITEAIYLALHDKSKDEIRKVMNKYYSLNFKLDDIREDYKFDVSCQGSVPQAIVAFLESEDFEDAIRNAISIGGDSDTIAAMTGSIAEAYYGVPNDIRKLVYERIEDDQKKIIDKFEQKYGAKIDNNKKIKLQQKGEVMAEKTNANIGFESELWEAACVLWGHIPSAEYRKVIIGLIFLRYISAAFDARYKQLVEDGEGFEEDIDFYISENVFYVPENARWNVIASAAHKPEIGMVIDDAMRAIEADNKSLKGVLPKNYSNPDLDKRVLGDVVDIFTNKIDMTQTEVDEDLLGRTYEYCLNKFAEKEGAGGGEFYTPSSVVKTLVEILRPFENCRVYDPACGSGGMFVQSAKFIQAHSGKRGAISVYGQEANADTWKMAKINMAIRGIDANFGPNHGDTFTNDLHPTLKADFILANPPFNYHPWGQEKLLDDVRWKYGIPPAGNANYAWIQHMIHHLAPNGKIGLVLANGSLSTQTSGEGEIRKKIIEDDLIEGIVALPTQLFYSVTIPVTLWFISKNKSQKGKTLFIDARNMGHMVDRKHRDFEDEDIKKLAETFEAFQNGTLEEIKGYCSVASIQDIEKQDYILTPGRYVGIEEQEDDGEPFEEKMTRLTSELSEMFIKSHELENEIRKKMEALGYEI